MKNKDQILLEQIYSKVINESLSFEDDSSEPNSRLSNQVFDVLGRKAKLKIERNEEEDDIWYNYSFVDPETKEYVANMNWGRGGMTGQDVLDYIKLGLPSGVQRASKDSTYPTRFNLDSNTLKKFIDGTAEKEGLELIPRTVKESTETILEAKKKKSKKKPKNKKKSKINDTGIRWGVGTYFTGGGYNFDDTSGDVSGDGA
jgi:hypothetical protein